jgi:hypothetical protein
MKQLLRAEFAHSLFILLVALASTARCGDAISVPGRAGLIDSTWPYGRSDSWRTSAVVGGAGLPKSFDPGSLVANSAPVPPVPFWGVTAPPDLCDDVACNAVGDDIFVLGGSPFLMKLFSFASPETIDFRPGESLLDANLYDPDVLDIAIAEANAVTPYIVRIDSRTMQVTGKAKLLNDTLNPLNKRSVNYTGDLVFHENGKLYAVATSTIFEVDPVSMDVTRRLELQLYDSDADSDTNLTVYNSLLVSPDTGDLITKGVNMFDASLPAKLIDVSTSTPDLEVSFTNDETSIAATRVTIAKQDGVPYVYASGNYETIRVEIGENQFVTQPEWSQIYRTPADNGKTTGAVGMTFMGDANFVAFPNNNSVGYGVTELTTLFTQATDMTDPPDTMLPQYPASPLGEAGGSFYSVAADPYNTGVIVFHDQITDITTAWQQGADGKLEVLWQKSEYSTAAGAAIASDQEHLYMGDRRCGGPGLTHCELFLVVLDLTTGDKLGEVRVPGTVPTLGEIFVGDNEVYFISSEAGEHGGYVTRIYLAPEPTSLLMLLLGCLPFAWRSRR